MPTKFTLDTLLEGKIRLKQIEGAYRAGLDAVLLASLVNLPNQESIKILDMGAGVGAVSLCLLWRLPKAWVTGIEQVPEYYELCKGNFKLNKFASKRSDVLLGDIKDFKHLHGSFDAVVMNPPYYKKGACRLAKADLKTQAHVEGSASLEEFISQAYRFLKPKGYLFLIHRTFRILEALRHNKKWGDVCLYPVYSYANSREAERSMVRMRKVDNGIFKVNQGIVIHNDDSSYTTRTEGIVCRGDSLEPAETFKRNNFTRYI